MKLVQIVADYGPGDLAFSEMINALTAHLPSGYMLTSTTLSSLDTLGTGFCVAQLGLGTPSQRPSGLIIYANCAPRKDLSKERENNQGEKLVYAVLKNSVPVVIVNSGFSLSFIKEEIAELWSVNVSRGGSQFRSRDIFPPVVGMVANGDFSFKKEKIDPADESVIPNYPRGVIVYQDSFKNLKTTFRDGDPEVAALTPGQQIDLTINGVTRPAVVATGNFNVREGATAFSPGSSGHGRRFWEVFLRGGEASELFNNPKPGAEVTISTPLLFK